jgi:hypothetical protein
MRTEFHRLVHKHKPHKFDQQRILFKTFAAAEDFVNDFVATGYNKPLQIIKKGQFYNVVRKTKSK